MEKISWTDLVKNEKMSEEGMEYLIYNKRTEGNMICLYLMQELPSKIRY